MLRQPCPAAIQDAGVDPAQVIGIGTDFTACTVLPVTARRHPAVPAARPGRPPARLPQAVEAPRRPAAGGPDQRAGPRARRAVDRPLRRQDLLRVAVRQGAAAAGGGPGDLRAGRPVDRGRRLDHLAADRHRDPQRLHRRVQGHLAGRALPVAGVPGRAQPGLRRVRRGQAGPPGRRARRPGRLAHRAGRRLDRAAGGHRGGGRERGRARHRARRAARSSPGQMVAIMGTSTCHVMNGAALAEVPGMCGVVDGGIVAGPWGYEAGQSGVGDIFAWFVDHARARRLPRTRRPARDLRARPADRARPRRSPRARTGWSRWTG